MTSSAFPFLDGRTTVDGPLVRIPGRRARRRHEGPHRRRDETDAYLDRSATSSVDWADALIRLTQR